MSNQRERLIRRHRQLLTSMINHYKWYPADYAVLSTEIPKQPRRLVAEAVRAKRCVCTTSRLADGLRKLNKGIDSSLQEHQMKHPNDWNIFGQYTGNDLGYLIGEENIQDYCNKWSENYINAKEGFYPGDLD